MIYACSLWFAASSRPGRHHVHQQNVVWTNWIKPEGEIGSTAHQYGSVRGLSLVMYFYEDIKILVSVTLVDGTDFVGSEGFLEHRELGF